MRIARELRYGRAIGCSKTIDNDVDGTEYSFGFDTAVNIATEVIDRLVHHRRKPPSKATVEKVTSARRVGSRRTPAWRRADVVPILSSLSDVTVVREVWSVASRMQHSDIIVVAEGAQAEGRPEIHRAGIAGQRRPFGRHRFLSGRAPDG